MQGSDIQNLNKFPDVGASAPNFFWDQLTGIFHSIGNFFGNFNQTIESIKIISQFLIIVFIFIILYSLVRLYEMQRDKEKKEIDIENEKTKIESLPEKNLRWIQIEEYIRSNNQNDWRSAIIEADNILDNLTIKLGFSGNSLGERLKSVDKSDFRKLDSAWEAHKVRNRIAHDGIDFEISQKQAQDTIDLYKEVFTEFNII